MPWQQLDLFPETLPRLEPHLQFLENWVSREKARREQAEHDAWLESQWAMNQPKRDEGSEFDV
jgi:hypothetical protein